MQPEAYGHKRAWVPRVTLHELGTPGRRRGTPGPGDVPGVPRAASGVSTLGHPGVPRGTPSPLNSEWFENIARTPNELTVCDVCGQACRPVGSLHVPGFFLFRLFAVLEEMAHECNMRCGSPGLLVVVDFHLLVFGCVCVRVNWICAKGCMAPGCGRPS